ncbi:MAG: hypothetical protein HY898_06040 [Deltaproteobacteria bacterium]|nr:hypothetical protein [Deltaproteobacteria bacterium]
MRPEHDHLAPAEEPRNSGVFSARPPRGLSTQQILVPMRRIVESGSIGVLLQSSCGQPQRAQVDPAPGPRPDAEFAVELRLAAWVSGIETTRLPFVPLYLKAWLPFVRAVVVPIYTPVWQAGVLIGDSTRIDRRRLGELVELAAEVALELETADRHYRQHVLRELAESPGGRAPAHWFARRRAS